LRGDQVQTGVSEAVTPGRSGLGASRAVRRRRLVEIIPSDRQVRIAALLVLLLYLALVIVVDWRVLGAMLTRAVGITRPDNASVAAAVVRLAAFELARLALAGLSAIVVLRHGRARRETVRIASVFVVSWTPVAIYSAGVLLAIAGGWEPDIQVFASRDATDAQVAETIREAMPIVMEPFGTGRHVANGSALLLLVALQHRVCGVSIRRAIAAAAAAGIVATLAVILT
jgi:hypothetical protein